MDIAVVDLLNQGSRLVVTAGVLGTVGYLRVIMRTIELNSFKQEATDYALEKSLGNGYSAHRKEKLDELMTESKYRKTGK